MIELIASIIKKTLTNFNRFAIPNLTISLEWCSILLKNPFNDYYFPLF
ncbi:hypothetical protein GMMP15_1530014 [Candidatus Magnetomoraceae bacterium gMMP-15]